MVAVDQDPRSKSPVVHRVVVVIWVVDDCIQNGKKYTVAVKEVILLAVVGTGSLRSGTLPFPIAGGITMLE